MSNIYTKVSTVFLTIVMCFLVLGGLQTTNAENAITSQPGVTLTPIGDQKSQQNGYYIVNVTPGYKGAFSFILTNNRPNTETYIVYPSDPASGINGGKIFNLPDDAKKNEGGWVSEKPQTLTLKAGEKKKLTFHVQVPNELKKGQYVAVIAVISAHDYDVIKNGVKESDIKSQNKNELGLSVYNANKLGVQIVMNYDEKSALIDMKLTDFKFDALPNGEFQISVGIANDGTIVRYPKIKVIIQDKDKNVMFTNTVESSSIYGSTQTFITNNVTKLLSPGNYTAIYDGDDNLHGEYDFTISKKDVSDSADILKDQGKIDTSVYKAVKKDTASFFASTTAIIIYIAVFLVILFVTVFIMMKRKIDQKKNELDERERKILKGTTPDQKDLGA